MDLITTAVTMADRSGAAAFHTNYHVKPHWTDDALAERAMRAATTGILPPKY
jgi:hypothetical protein